LVVTPPHMKYRISSGLAEVAAHECNTNSWWFLLSVFAAVLLYMNKLSTTVIDARVS
jgi:hypothetical protein